jgi:uncharacterized protein
MEFCYRIQPARLAMLSEGPTPEEMQAVDDHFQYLLGLHRRGVLTFAGRTTTGDARTFGIAVYFADSEEDARAILESDPAISAGVFEAELFPFKTAIPEGEE